MAESAGRAFTWLLRLVVLIVLLAAGWYFRASLLKALREFLQGLRAWWAGLLGGKRGATPESAPSVAAAPMPRLPAWRDFADPFASGQAGRTPPGELIRYTFAALEAWARESGQTRRIQETPLEFTRRLRASGEQLGREAQTVAELYGQLAFAREALPTDAVAAAKRLWQQLKSPPAVAVVERSEPTATNGP